MGWRVLRCHFGDGIAPGALSSGANRGDTHTDFMPTYKPYQGVGRLRDYFFYMIYTMS